MMLLLLLLFVSTVCFYCCYSD